MAKYLQKALKKRIAEGREMAKILVNIGCETKVKRKQIFFSLKRFWDRFEKAKRV